MDHGLNVINPKNFVSRKRCCHSIILLQDGWTDHSHFGQDGVHFPGYVSMGFARQLLSTLCH